MLRSGHPFRSCEYLAARVCLLHGLAASDSHAASCLGGQALLNADPVNKPVMGTVDCLYRQASDSPCNLHLSISTKITSLQPP